MTDHSPPLPHVSSDELANLLISQLPTDLPSRPEEHTDQGRLILTHPPKTFGMYCKALFNRRAGLKVGELIPKLYTSFSLNIDQGWTKRYLDICGWSISNPLYLPLTAPQVLAAPLHTYLLTHRLFPVSPLGIVHAANEIVCHQPIPVTAQLTFTIWTGDTRWRERGFEFDLHTSVTADGSQSPNWLARTVIFRSTQKRQTSRGKSSATPSILLGTSHELQLAKDLGRRYAPIAGDHNPIHLYPITAQLFGFKRPIVHGMWTLARSLCLVDPSTQHLKTGTLSVRFKRPLLLPHTATSILSIHEDHTCFQVLDERGRSSLEGAILTK